MTKLSAILVAPTMQLRQLPPADRDVLRRVLFDCVQGLNEDHQKRWMRFWRRMFDARPGEALAFYPEVDRSRPFHSRWMAIEQRLFDNTEAFVHMKGFREWLKTGAAWGEYRLVGERMKFVPRSIDYETCSDDEMREFVADATAFLHTERALRRLWPRVTPAEREHVLEVLMRDPNEPPMEPY